MKWLFPILIAFIILNACSNSNEVETGEIKAIKMFKEAIITRSKSTIILDTRKIITRKKVDDADIPVLFVGLENGQNGTLTLFPGKGVGSTWLGADGSTITLERGVIKATRGMKNDVMGSQSFMPFWPNIKDNSDYTRQISYLNGDNQMHNKAFLCKTKKHKKPLSIKIFDVRFITTEFTETCKNNSEKLRNSYFVDDKNIVRRSVQYHGPVLGYLTIERLDR